MLALCIALSGVLLASAVPVAKETNFIADSTCEIAAALLKGHNAQDENMAFSPFGYNSLLAIFAEGAKGKSREELASALHLPEDVQLVRETYRNVLQQLREKHKENRPEMKNWFYIYRNFTVNEDVKDILRKFYVADVKTVDRLDEFEKNDFTKVKVPAGLQGKPTDHLINVEKEVEGIIETASSPHKSDSEEANTNNANVMLDSMMDSTDKKKDESLTEDLEKKNELLETPKKEESIVEEILPGTANTNEKTQLPVEEKVKLEDIKTETKLSEEKVDIKEPEKVELVKEEVAEKIKVEPEESNIVDKTDKLDEVMVAMQRRALEEDMSGLTDSSVKMSGANHRSEILIFNGLYFNGEWENQFTKRTADDSRSFSKTNGDKVHVSTIHSEGEFKIATIPELSSRAIELKYKEGRYSLLIVLPDALDGLHKLVADIGEYPINKIYDALTEKQVDVCLPTFQVMTISKPVPSSEKLALTNVQSIFDPESADFSGFSEEKGLFVEDLVQAVGFEVDSKYSEANFLAASLASSRSDIDVEEFKVDHPFLFYLRDNTNGIILVNGKIVNPTAPAEDYKSGLKTLM